MNTLPPMLRQRPIRSRLRPAPGASIGNVLPSPHCPAPETP